LYESLRSGDQTHLWPIICWKAESAPAQPRVGQSQPPAAIRPKSKHGAKLQARKSRFIFGGGALLVQEHHALLPAGKSRA